MADHYRTDARIAAKDFAEKRSLRVSKLKIGASDYHVSFFIRAHEHVARSTRMLPPGAEWLDCDTCDLSTRGARSCHKAGHHQWVGIEFRHDQHVFAGPNLTEILHAIGRSLDQLRKLIRVRPMMAGITGGSPT